MTKDLRRHFWGGGCWWAGEAHKAKQRALRTAERMELVTEALVPRVRVVYVQHEVQKAKLGREGCWGGSA